jgi:hypothetical protein
MPADIYFGILSYPLLHVDDATIDRWLAYERQIMDREEATGRLEKKLRINDHVLRCIGGEHLRAVMRKEPRFPDSNIVSVRCRSNEGIEIEFQSEPSDLPDFYALVSSIHKVR